MHKRSLKSKESCVYVCDDDDDGGNDGLLLCADRGITVSSRNAVTLRIFARSKVLPSR